MTRHFTFLFLSWLFNWMSASAQPTAYSKQVLAKIQQVEHHLAGNIRSSDDKDWTLQERMAYYQIPGLSIAVVHDYQIEWIKAYGLADLARRTPVTSQTRFLAGSISKSLNGIGLLTLVQDKKIDLYADINQYLTSWKFPYDSLANGKKINTANLLSHSAGLNINHLPGYSVGETIPTVVQILNGQKPANTEAVRSIFEPGIKYQYSGGGTTVSQLLLSDVVHQPYDQYLWERVLKPMGMVNSSFTQPPVKSIHQATGYDTNGKPIIGQYHIYPEQAAAGLWTTPTDIARYIIETQLAYQGKSNKVLSQLATRLRLTPYVDSSTALGVFIEKKGDHVYFTHNGWDEGFTSLYYGGESDGNGVAIMVNSDNGGILYELANSVARVYHWVDFYQPLIRKTTPVVESILESYVGEYESDMGIYLITKEGDRLYQSRKNGMKYEIFPESETKFFFKAIDSQLEFIHDASGRVVKRLSTYKGQTSEAKKIK